jgi:tRNA-splicing ligase RtcB
MTMNPGTNRIGVQSESAAARPTGGRFPIDIRAARGALPIRCFCSSDLEPDDASRSLLEKVAALPELVRHVSVLPDVHFKSRNPTPVGTVIVSRDMLVPRAIDRGIACGMRMVATSIPASELTPEILDAVYGRLLEALPVKEHLEPILTHEQCERAIVGGLSEVRSELDLSDDDIGRVEDCGHMMPEIPAAAIRAILGGKALDKGNRWMGTLGAGSHFLELQEITEILSDGEARALGLERGHVIFMMHTDARKLGKHILKSVLEEAEQSLGLREADHPAGVDGLWTLPADSDLGQRLVCGIVATCHASFVNRAVTTAILRRTMHQVLGDRSLRLPLIYDCNHETILRERHGNEWLWVHRHGASSARPPGVLTHDPVLAAIGQPVPIPGSMGSDSYVAVTQPGVAESFHSVAHGAGRLLEKVQANDAFNPAEVEGDVRSRGIRLYRYFSDNISGQAPGAFKNVHRVVEAMAAFDLIRPVVRLRPLAVLKG